jgi:sporulation protein YlmC with PRC-barrel domain
MSVTNQTEIEIINSLGRHLVSFVRKGTLRGVAIMGLAAALSFCTGDLRAQVAGSTTFGASQEEMNLVALGWSAKKKILGKAVYNEKNEKIGTVDDIIIAPDRGVSFAIIGVGGFLGIGKHDVAIPINQIREEKDRLILPGATKEALKALPEFQYAKADKTKRG